MVTKARADADKVGSHEKDAKAIKEEEDKIVYIKSGVDVSYGEVVDIINEVRELGVDKIGLVADKKKGSGEAPAASRLRNRSLNRRSSRRVFRGAKAQVYGNEVVAVHERCRTSTSHR